MGKTHDIFNKLYKAITIFAFSFLITPVVYLAFFLLLGLNAFFAFATTMALLTAGYFIQAAFAKITRVKRKPQDLSYESNTKFFSIKDSALPIAICVAISIVFFNVVTGYMKYRVEAGIDLSYDRDSLFPYIMMIFVAGIMITGVVLWFFPYSRIISMRSMFVYFVLFVIIFLYSYDIQWISTLCLIVFLLCSLIILNQSYIIKTISLTKIGVVTPRVRLYNIGIVLLFAVGVLFALVFVSSILVGLTIVFQFLFYLTLGTIFGNDGVTSGEDIGNSIGEASFNISLLNMDGNDLSVHALWYFFIFIVVVAIISLIFIRRIRNIFKSISDFFSALIKNIMSLFTDIAFFFTFDGGKDEDDDTINYKDEEIDVDNISAKLKMQEFSKKRKVYKDYTNKFNSLKTVNEKYIFAYQTLVQCWNEMDFSLRKSDTPRQIKDKISARTTIEDIPHITETFEIIYYGNFIADNNISNKISKMNRLIKRYYD